MLKYFFLLLTTALVGLVSFQDSSPGPEPPQDEWIPIFNGENLEGWTPKFAGIEAGVNHKNTFRVEDGLLKVSYEEYDQFNDRFGHLFYEQPYSHYKIRAEYRFVGKQIPGAPDWAWRLVPILSPSTMGRSRSRAPSVKARPSLSPYQ